MLVSRNTALLTKVVIDDLYASYFGTKRVTLALGLLTFSTLALALQHFTLCLQTSGMKMCSVK